MRLTGAVLLCAAVAFPGCRGAPREITPPEEELLLGRTGRPEELCLAMLRAAQDRARDEAGRQALGERLVTFLLDEDPGLRRCAARALVVLVGEDPVGYRAYGPRPEREARARAWEEYLEAWRSTGGEGDAGRIPAEETGAP